MIFAVTAPASSRLTMMLLGLISRWTRPLLMDGSQTGRDLRRNFERQLYLKPA